MNKALTLSIAAYNVESYLDHLMESIINARVMDQIEVLIIDDGSQDRTAEIASRYQSLYPLSVRLITKENGGHGSTINRGIEEATGKYFRALDGDDWVSSEHLSGLVDKLHEIDTDIILAEYCCCDENDVRTVVNEFPELEKGRIYYFNDIWYPGFWMRYHTVIYRTEILKQHHIHLDEHCYYVDVEYMLYPIPYISTIYFFEDYIYCYRVGIEGQSVSNKSRMKNIDHSKKVGMNLIKYYQSIQDKLSEEKKRYFLDEITFHCRWHEESLLLFKCSKKKKDELISFEKCIRERDQGIYRQMGATSKVLTVLRITCYHTYRLAAFYIKKKKFLSV